MIFFIADTHFSDTNILIYERNNFNNILEMNETIINNWNKIVSQTDVVYHLGDVGKPYNYFHHLNGTKILIKGNHDTLPNQDYIRQGFDEVIDYPIILEDFWILSHKPMYVNQYMPYVNIFGHVHNNPIYNKYSHKHFCVCVERINYTPISFGTIKYHIEEKNRIWQNNLK